MKSDNKNEKKVKGYGLSFEYHNVGYKQDQAIYKKSKN